MAGAGRVQRTRASWAAHVVLCERLGLDPAATSVADLRDALDRSGPALITMSAGTMARRSRGLRG